MFHFSGSGTKHMNFDENEGQHGFGIQDWTSEQTERVLQLVCGVRYPEPLSTSENPAVIKIYGFNRQIIAGNIIEHTFPDATGVVKVICVIMARQL